MGQLGRMQVEERWIKAHEGEVRKDYEDLVVAGFLKDLPVKAAEITLEPTGDLEVSVALRIQVGEEVRTLALAPIPIDEDWEKT